jgi:hypothetical protein
MYKKWFHMHHNLFSINIQAWDEINIQDADKSYSLVNGHVQVKHSILAC